MENKIKIAKITLAIIIVAFITLGIMAVASAFTVNTNDSTIGKVTFITLMKIAWWPILITVILMLSYILYGKRYKYGAILEILIGGILLANTIINMINYGTKFLVVILTILIPIVLIVQGIMIVIGKDNNTNKTETIKKESKIKKEKENKTRKSRKIEISKKS